MRLDRSQRILEIKLVYCGPARSGKTTNLRALHRFLPACERTLLTSLKTEGDRTLFFDFLPVKFEIINGCAVKLRLFSVPGESHYAATRRLVLQDADGVVFVADSGAEAVAADVHALDALRDDLRANGLDAKGIPIVMQHNKRDLPTALSLAALDAKLVAPGWARIEAVASRGTGVRETFVTAAARTVASALEQVNMTGVRLGRLEELLTRLVAGQDDATLVAATRERAERAERGHAAGYVLATPSHGAPMEQQVLEQALTSATLLSADLASAVSALDRRRAELSWLAEFAGAPLDAPRDLAELVRRTAEATGAPAASLLVVSSATGRVDPGAVHGLPADPLSGAMDAHGVALSDRLLEQGRPVVTHDVPGQVLRGASVPALAAIRSLLSVPIVGAGRSLGLLALFGLDGSSWRPQADEVNFARAVAALLVPHVLMRRHAATSGRSAVWASSA